MRYRARRPGLGAVAGRSRVRRRRSGFTLIEVLFGLAVLSILMGIAAPSLRGLSNDLENASAETAGFLRQVRTKAMGTTSAYRVVFVSATHLRTEYARRCTDTTWQPDDRIQLHLRERAEFVTTGLSTGDVLLCFGSRGVADASPTLLVRDHQRTATEIEVFLGGAIRTTRLTGGE